MKNLILILAASVITFQASAQAKFYTNNGAKQVTELSCSLNDVKATLPVLSDFANHDFIHVAIGEDRNDGSTNRNDFSNYKDFKPEYFKGKKDFSVWIKKANSEYGDLCGTYMPFKDKEPCYISNLACDADWRNYTASDVVIKVFGKDITGKVWENNAYVNTYGFKELAVYKIKKEYGPVATFISDAFYKVPKFIEGSQKSKIVLSDDLKRAEVYYSAVSGSDARVHFTINAIGNGGGANPVMDMSGGAPSKSNASLSIDDVKNTVSVNLYRNANLEEARKIKEPSNGLFFGNYLYEPFVAGKKKSTSNSKSSGGMMNKLGKAYGISGKSGSSSKGGNYAKNIEAMHNALEWKPAKIGNLDGQILELDVYTSKQWSTSSATGEFYFKDGQEGKTKKLWLFVAEKNGVVYGGSIVKEKGRELEGDEQQFINHTLKTIEIL